GDALFPVVPTLADHTGDEVDVDLLEAELPCPAVGAMNLLFEMGTAIKLKNFRIEILDAETEARHAHLAQSLKLVLLQRARFALEGHFLSALPRQHRLQTLHQTAQLRRAQIRRCAASEINVFQGPATDQRDAAV